MLDLAADIECRRELVAYPRTHIETGCAILIRYRRARFHKEGHIIHHRILIAAIDQPEIKTVAVMAMAIEQHTRVTFDIERRVGLRLNHCPVGGLNSQAGAGCKQCDDE